MLLNLQGVNSANIYISLGRSAKVLEYDSNTDVSFNPYPAEPGYTLPLQTV